MPALKKEIDDRKNINLGLTREKNTKTCTSIFFYFSFLMSFIVSLFSLVRNYAWVSLYKYHGCDVGDGSESSFQLYLLFIKQTKRISDFLP